MFVSSKISQAQIQCDRMEKLDAAGHNAMFGDDDTNFDLQLKSFGVDMGALKEPAIKHVFLGMGGRLGRENKKEK